MSFTSTAAIDDILGHIMSDIEKFFLDFMSILLHLSQTYHSLHDALVDTLEARSPKLKVS